MSGGPVVTVVIPTHNRRTLLLRTLDSVLRQEEVRIEVVVVDDGGSDGTTDAVTRLGCAAVRTLRHDRSKGVSAARNAGLATVATPWVAFVDDDDLWAPDKLRHQIAALEQAAGARWSCVAAVHVDADLDVGHHAEAPDPRNVAKRMLREQAIPGGGSGVLVEARLARDVGGFDDSISILADWDFYLRLSMRAPVASVNQPLLAYFVHSDSMYHDPLGIVRELAYLERKYQHLPKERRFHFDRTTWLPRVARMAHVQGDRGARRALLWSALHEAGPAPFIALVARKVRRKLRMLRETSPTTAFDEAQLGWLARYRRWEQ